MAIDDGGLAKDETLLDRFAGLAMQALITVGATPSQALAELARRSYGIAKAMVEEKPRLEEENTDGN